MLGMEMSRFSCQPREDARHIFLNNTTNKVGNYEFQKSNRIVTTPASFNNRSEANLVNELIFLSAKKFVDRIHVLYHYIRKVF